MFVSRADIDQALRQPIENPYDILIVGCHFIEKGGGILEKSVVTFGYTFGCFGHGKGFFKRPDVG